MNDPRNYDVRELRTLAGAQPAPAQGGGASAQERTVPGPARNRSEARAYADQFSELLLGTRREAARPSGRPYLETLPSGIRAERLVSDWISFLVDVGGPGGARRALAYYERIRWISPGVRQALAARIPGGRPPRHVRPFEPADHRISLCSLQRIAAVGATRTDQERSTPARGTEAGEPARGPPARRADGGPTETYDNERRKRDRRRKR